ncbi:MAG: TlpA disulfide reductase family protein [Ignavibacteriales bacterium]|nr:TlpA disulfide reductase family protein [Ignavibacteriales bacterium]
MLLSIGVMVILAGAIWVCVIAFKNSILEGLLSLLVIPYTLYYIFKQWPETRIPFFIILGGFGIYLLGVFLPVEAADFTLKDLEGRVVNLNNLRGKVVLLDFWASWCPPCQAELPLIEKLHKEFKNKGLVVLGVNDEGTKVAQDFNKAHNFTFPTVEDVQHEIFKLYNVEAFPTVFVIDGEGEISTNYVGMQSEEELRLALSKAGIE